MSITITEAAKEKIINITKDSSNNNGYFRIQVIGGGCSGFSYKFSVVDEVDDSFESFEFGEAKICVDKLSYPLVVGTELDYSTDIFKSEFIINNPNAKRSCGCGESFSV